MSIENYGVWVSTPKRVSAEREVDDNESPHIHLFYDDGSGGQYDGTRRASINVKSQSSVSELVYWLIRDFRHPIVEELGNLDMGFHNLENNPQGGGLDYIRGNLITFEQGRILPHDQPGVKDDIIDYVFPELIAAINRNATIYLFGEPYSDNQGIHDIHMNQGSVGRFKKSNGVWQDGGIIIGFPSEKRFDAIFLAFASQAVHTDDETGNSLPGSQNFAQFLGQSPGDGTTIDDNVNVAIVAALVNPIGSENQPNRTTRPEMVYLLNRSTKGISLEGWKLLNKTNDVHTVSSDIWLEQGEARNIPMFKAPLSNNGGIITLLDKSGNKIHGVSYTKKQAQKEGELIIF